MCEEPATVNVYRAECSLSDADSRFFPKQKFFLREICFMAVGLTEKK
jgi:hypothetical protein